MKQLSTIIESILGTDLDIRDEDVLPLMGDGYICTRCTGNAKFWDYVFSAIQVGRNHFNMDILAAARIARNYSLDIDKIISLNPKFRMNDILYLTALLLSQARATEEGFIQAFDGAVQPSAKRVRCEYKYKKTGKTITFSGEWPRVGAKINLTFKKK